MSRHPEEFLPEAYKNWFWGNLKRLVWLFFLLWTVIAIWWHLPAPSWKNFTILGSMPLHWYTAAFFSIWAGVILIFIYHALATRLEDRFWAMVGERWEELPEEVRIALSRPSGEPARVPGD